MKLVNSATWIKYNANNRGNNVGDCVKRGLSIAFDIDYNAVSKELLQIMHDKQKTSWKIRSVYEEFIQRHGGSNPISLEEPVEVGTWIDDNPNGTFILLTGSKSDKYQTDHLTCAIDGRLIDSWNSLSEYVKEYYIVEGREPLEFSGIEDHLTDIGNQARDLILEQIIKYAEKCNITDCIEWKIGNASINAFQVKVPIYIKVDKYDNPTYRFTIAYVFSPSISLEEATKKVKEITKVRMYDRFYAIKKQLAEMQEAHELYEQSPDKRKHDLYIWGGREERFFNSLPGWCKPFITDLDVQNPGMYSDSYTLTMIPLPGDSKRDRIHFWGGSSDMIKKELQMYKEEGFKRPDEDYSVYDTLF